MYFLYFSLLQSSLYEMFSDSQSFFFCTFVRYPRKRKQKQRKKKETLFVYSYVIYIFYSFIFREIFFLFFAYQFFISEKKMPYFFGCKCTCAVGILLTNVPLVYTCFAFFLDVPCDFDYQFSPFNIFFLFRALLVIVKNWKDLLKTYRTGC